MTNTNKTVDFAALDLLCDKLECGGANHRATANQIRIAINGAKPQLPEGIEWPRFEDGELVKFGDEFKFGASKHTVGGIKFSENDFALFAENEGLSSWYGYFKHDTVKRPEPEILDADGVPIKVGDTVWDEKGKELTVKQVHFIDPEEGEEPEHIIWCGEYIKEGYPLHRIAKYLTHRKPDTRESVRTEIVKAIKADYAVNLLPLFDRYEAAVLRELGGE